MSNAIEYWNEVTQRIQQENRKEWEEKNKGVDSNEDN